MSKKIILFLFSFILSVPTLAQRTASGMNDAQKLGTTAGAALACKAEKKLDDYELISSYILANQAATEKARKQLFKDYAEAKLSSYNLQKNNNLSKCSELLKAFNAQPIFKAKIASNGTVTFPDGKILRPKMNYNTKLKPAKKQ